MKSEELSNPFQFKNKERAVSFNKDFLSNNDHITKTKTNSFIIKQNNIDEVILSHNKLLKKINNYKDKKESLFKKISNKNVNVNVMESNSNNNLIEILKVIETKDFKNILSSEKYTKENELNKTILLRQKKILENGNFITRHMSQPKNISKHIKINGRKNFQPTTSFINVNAPKQSISMLNVKDIKNNSTECLKDNISAINDIKTNSEKKDKGNIKNEGKKYTLNINYLDSNINIKKNSNTNLNSSNNTENLQFKNKLTHLSHTNNPIVYSSTNNLNKFDRKKYSPSNSLSSSKSRLRGKNENKANKTNNSFISNSDSSKLNNTTLFNKDLGASLDDKYRLIKFLNPNIYQKYFTLMPSISTVVDSSKTKIGKKSISKERNYYNEEVNKLLLNKKINEMKMNKGEMFSKEYRAFNYEKGLFFHSNSQIKDEKKIFTRKRRLSIDEYNNDLSNCAKDSNDISILNDKKNGRNSKNNIENNRSSLLKVGDFNNWDNTSKISKFSKSNENFNEKNHIRFNSINNNNNNSNYMNQKKSINLNDNSLNPIIRNDIKNKSLDISNNENNNCNNNYINDVVNNNNKSILKKNSINQLKRNLEIINNPETNDNSNVIANSNVNNQKRKVKVKKNPTSFHNSALNEFQNYLKRQRLSQTKQVKEHNKRVILRGKVVKILQQEKVICKKFRRNLNNMNLLIVEHIRKITNADYIPNSSNQNNFYHIKKNMNRVTEKDNSDHSTKFIISNLEKIFTDIEIMSREITTKQRLLKENLSKKDFLYVRRNPNYFGKLYLDEWKKDTLLSKIQREDKFNNTIERKDTPLFVSMFPSLKEFAINNFNNENDKKKHTHGINLKNIIQQLGVKADLNLLSIRGKGSGMYQGVNDELKKKLEKSQKLVDKIFKRVSVNMRNNNNHKSKKSSAMRSSVTSNNVIGININDDSIFNNKDRSVLTSIEKNSNSSNSNNTSLIDGDDVKNNKTSKNNNISANFDINNKDSKDSKDNKDNCQVRVNETNNNLLFNNDNNRKKVKEGILKLNSNRIEENDNKKKFTENKFSTIEYKEENKNKTNTPYKLFSKKVSHNSEILGYSSSEESVNTKLITKKKNNYNKFLQSNNIKTKIKDIISNTNFSQVTQNLIKTNNSNNNIPSNKIISTNKNIRKLKLISSDTDREEVIKKKQLLTTTFNKNYEDNNNNNIISKLIRLDTNKSKDTKNDFNNNEKDNYNSNSVLLDRIKHYDSRNKIKFSEKYNFHMKNIINNSMKKEKKDISCLQLKLKVNLNKTNDKELSSMGELAELNADPDILGRVKDNLLSSRRSYIK